MPTAEIPRITEERQEIETLVSEEAILTSKDLRTKDRLGTVRLLSRVMRCASFLNCE